MTNNIDHRAIPNFTSTVKFLSGLSDAYSALTIAEAHFQRVSCETGKRYKEETDVSKELYRIRRELSNFIKSLDLKIPASRVGSLVEHTVDLGD